MAIDAISANQIRIAQTGVVYSAVVGSTGPTDVTTALNASWTNLGYVTEDGVSITPKVDLKPISAWQSPMPVKYALNSTSMEVKFKLMQTNKEIMAVYYPGSAWVNGASGIATLTMPASPTISSLEIALVVEFTDDNSEKGRLYIARAIVSDREATKLTRSDVTEFGLTVMAMADSNNNACKILSNSLDLYSS